MNTTRKSILSILLAIALLLPMVPPVRADEKVDGAEEVTLTLDPSSGIDVYYRTVDPKAVTITATASRGYAGKITWTPSKNAPLSADLAFGTALDYNDKNRVIHLTADKVAEETAVTLTVTLDGDVSKQVEIRVKPDEVKPITVKPSEFTLTVGDSRRLAVTALDESDDTPAAVTFGSADPQIATVDKSGTVTAVSKGTTTINVKAGSQSAKATVTVEDPTADLKATAKLGTDLEMLDIYETMLLRYNNVFSSSRPTDIRFIGISSGEKAGENERVGELRDKAGVVSDGTYDFITLRNMYFRPKAAGTFVFSYELSTGSANKLVGTVTITVSVPVTNIRIPISSDGDYSFDRASMDASGKTGAMLIRDAVGNSFGSIRFGAVDSGNNVGTLYTSSAATNADRVVSGTVVTNAALDELYFIPNRSGNFSIEYSAYSGKDGKGALLCSGVIIIPVDAKSLEIKIDLDEVEPYLFSNAPRAKADSAYDLFIDTINASVGRREWEGIRFGTPSSSSANVGKLYQDKRHTSHVLTDDVFIARADISDLYFVPDRAGTYTVSYSVYSDSSSSTPVATGTLTINVSSIPMGSADITYTTSVNNTVSVNENDFIDFFRKKHTNKYYLSYVVFDDYEGEGTFYHDSTRFVAYNSADLYTSSFTGSLPGNAHFLDRLTFSAPAKSGFTAVKFTCYGGTSSNSTTTVTHGVLYIFYTSGDVPAVTYDAYSSSTVDLREQDFVTVYNTAMKTNVSKPVFSIRLLTVPSNGALYRYYNQTMRTTLTSSNIGDYTFTINASSAVDSIEKLTYIPNRNASGTDSAAYIAYSVSGELLYTGTIEFKLNADNVAFVTSDGYTFSPSAFYQANDTDPVLYVTFQKPEAGRMYALAGSRYVPVDETVRFYTSSISDGTYPLTAALYAPRAGMDRGVTLTAVAHRRSGATFNYVVVLTPVKKNFSAVFTDVNGVTGWASDAIDFANRIGLVKGISENPPCFGPLDTMRRCDLVLILYRLAGTPAVAGSMPYVDVPAGAYYYNSALWAYQNGIMRGVANGTYYNPETALLRQDFAQILYNYTASQGISTANNGSLQGYYDANQVSPETLEGVRWAVANGYFTSASTTALTIEPTRSATRAEIVTLLQRYLTY